ncbi:MAG: hypothetical protein ABFC56_02950 [Clostridiaceae bacterium]
MTETKQVVLGDKTFDIEFPLTIGQLKIVEPAITRILELNKSGVTPETYAHMITLLEACFAPKYPEMTVEAISKLRVEPSQLLAAYYAIGEASSVIKKLEPGDALMGEAEAKPSQSTGD